MATQSKTNSRNIGKIVKDMLGDISPHSEGGVRVVATACYRDMALWESLQSRPSSIRLSSSAYHIPNMDSWLELVSAAIVAKAELERKGEETPHAPAYAPNDALLMAMSMRSDSRAFNAIGHPLTYNSKKVLPFRLQIVGIGKLVVNMNLNPQGKKHRRYKLANRGITSITSVSHVRILGQYGKLLHCVGRAKIARQMFAKVGVDVGEGKTARIERKLVSVHHTGKDGKHNVGEFFALGIVWREWSKIDGERVFTGDTTIMGLDGSRIGVQGEYLTKVASTGNKANRAVVEFVLNIDNLPYIAETCKLEDWRKRPIVCNAHVVSRYMRLAGLSLLHSEDKPVLRTKGYVPFNPAIKLDAPIVDYSKVIQLAVKRGMLQAKQTHLLPATIQ